MLNYEFKDRLKAINPNIIALEEYQGSNTKILCRCITCNNEWKITPGHLLSGRGCPVCSRKLSTAKRTKSHETFLQEVSINNPNINILSQYSGASRKVDCMCVKCGYHWMARASNLIRGTGCPRCAGNAKKTTSEFLEEIKSLHPTIEILSDYSSADEKVVCRCTLCKKTWKAIPNSLLGGSGCPTCFKRYQTSFAEQAILFYIKKYFHNTIGTYTLDGIEFDIFIEEFRVAIEYDGFFWHKNRLDHDNVKDKFCVDNGIRLIRIREPGLINTSFAVNINRVNNTDDGLHSCIMELLSLLGVACPDINLASDRIDILSNYYLRIKADSLASTNPSLAKEWHPTKNKDISPDMVLAHSGKKFWWKCPTCGNEWESTPDHRSRGRGCPKCRNADSQRRRRKNHESFIKDVQSQNTEIIILGTYISSRTPLECQCVNCDYKFQSIPHDILQGRSCPICAKKNKLLKIRKSPDVFEQEMQQLHPSIKPLEPYVNAKHPLKCECKRCGFLWETTPDRLHSGTGCPKCAGNARMSHEEFVEMLKEKNPNIEALGRYESSNKKVKYACKLCGYIGEMKASHLKAGHGCPLCARKRINK